MSKCLSLVSILLITCTLCGQEQSYNFHLLDQGNGLNEGTILGFGQDKYGYIWIGTASGLNKFDGYSVVNYLPDATDSSTIMQAAIYVIYRHTDGSLWIGGDNGLMEYDYATDKFSWISDKGIITEIKPGPGNMVIISSTQGLFQLDPATKKVARFSDLYDIPNDTLLNTYIRDIDVWKEKVVIAGKQDLLEFNLATRQISIINLPTKIDYVYKGIEITPKGEVWLSVMTYPHLVRSDMNFKQANVREYLFPEKGSNLAYAITDFEMDTRGRMWITTSLDGLCYYNEEKDKFHRIVNNPLLPSSPVVNHLTKLFQDDNGLIWIATTGFGVNYFDPYNTLFTTFLPAPDYTTPETWKRVLSASQDKHDNIWISTGIGVLWYDADMNLQRTFTNSPGKPDQLHYNSVRAVVPDDDYVWFATGRGINRFHPESGKMDFFTAEDGLPQGFYSHAFRDSKGTIWFCSKENDKLYYFEKGATRGRSIAEHPVMYSLKNVGTKMVYEDTRHRLWIGLNSFGVAMFDPATDYFEIWWNNDKDPNRRPGDYIASIAEDSSGVIWVGSRLGLFSYDFTEKKFVHHNEKNGFYNTKASCIQVDPLNRLWIGTTKGLVMMDTSRLHSRLFDTHDGLPIYEFADMPSSVLSDGRFIYPMNKGVVIFNPLDYRETETTPPFYVSSFNVLTNPLDLQTNTEELTSLDLNWNQNYFTIQLTSPHFQNPGRIWYAYILEGFDQQWHYTQDRVAQYTNVPGGDYLFKYKVSMDNVDWSGEEKTLSISIDTIFYKTWWFWSLIGLCVAFLTWQYYRMRINKQREIFALQTKTTSLEKEKTQIQYENLKQQLNPHFLFNSLTSLRSLIRVDQKMATHFLDGLSKTYRYLLKSGDNEVVTLEEELNFVETFIELQKTRFRNGLQVEVNVDPKYLNKMIVPVTLQNLLENAIKHNMTSEDHPLHIRIYTEEGMLVIRNNLQRYRHVETSNKRGLNGMRSLYRYMTEDPIAIEEDEHYFTVKIPLL